MKKPVIGTIVLVMALGSMTYAVTYEQGTVKDTPAESGDPDASMGDAGDVRLYPEFNGGDPEGKGIRPAWFQWDLSSIPTGSTITSATMHLYLDRINNAPAVTGYKVFRLLPGKDWVESTTYFSPANTGELTWNSQKHGVAAWSSPGAGGASDVDIAGSVSFDASGGSDLQIALDVTSMVTEWVTNGVENNGVVLRGGTIAGVVTGTNHWDVGFRENTNAIERPYLTIEWVAAGICSTVTPVDTQTGSGFEGGGGAPDVLHAKGTPPSPGTGFWYAPILHPTYTIAAGDHFVYDIYTNNASGASGSVDIEFAGGNLRDSGILDQNNISGHPGTNISAQAYQQWYSRDFDLSSLAGTAICNFEMAHDSSTASPSEFFIRNVKIVNGATTQLVVFDPNTWVSDTDPSCSPGNNGYTSLVGPQIDPDPTGLQSITYTITNVGGTAFDWTVTEVLSDGTTPNDYAWLTLDPTSGTGLAASASQLVVATLDSTTLTAGLHTAYLRFSNNCTPPVVDIRQIDFNVIGCLIEVLEPRLRFPGPCVSSATSTEDFTIKNNGAFDWTGYQAIEFGDDDDWLTLSYTSSSVAQSATATVTATIDWSQVAVTGGGDDQAGTIRFSASCDGGSTFVHDTPVGSGIVETINVVDPVITPIKVLYNGDVSPSLNDAGGTGYKFALWEGTEQGAIEADAQADDGFAYRIQDTNVSSANKTKWQSVLNNDTPAMDIDTARGATVLGRVKVLSATGSTFQANLMILHPSIAGAYHWGGPNNLVKETQRDISTAVTGDTDYHIVRITSKDTQSALGIVVNLYLDENPTPVLTINNAAASGHGSIDAVGFGCGASTFASQDIYYDWVSGTNAGAFAPGEEDDCIGSLYPVDNCNTPRVDADADTDVDGDDFAELQKCYTGPLVSPPPLSQLCDCFDSDNDNDIDVVDFLDFVDCETGANVPWVTSVNCPN